MLAAAGGTVGRGGPSPGRCDGEGLVQPLRILHVLTHHQVTRGGAVQALLLARAQRQRGHQVAIACHAKKSLVVHPTFAPWVAGGLTVEPFRMLEARELFRFRRLLRTLRPDVVHAHRNLALGFTWLGSLLASPPAIIFQRGTTRAPQSRRVAFLLRSSRVHRIIAVAHAVKDSLAAYDVDPGKVEVVYGSYDEERFDPARADGARVRRELGIGPEQPVVVQVGKLNRRKAPDQFVRMAAEVVRVRPEAAFLLAGATGDRAGTCERLRTELGVGDRLHVLGFRSDVPDLYAAADVVVNCSVADEGLTGALREAVAMGRPVVATRISGNPELIDDGRSGLLVPPRDPARMAAAVLDLLANPGRARALGEAGRAFVRRNMAEARRIEQVERIYREVLEARGRPRAAAASS